MLTVNSKNWDAIICYIFSPKWSHFTEEKYPQKPGMDFFLFLFFNCLHLCVCLCGYIAKVVKLCLNAANFLNDMY